MEPLYAQIALGPEEHDGSKFELLFAFSDPIRNSYRNDDDAPTVTGGQVAGASRSDGKSDLWKFRITPDGTGPVTFTLPEGGTCGSDHPTVLCTSDGRTLSEELSYTIRSLAEISIDDSSAAEDSADGMTFTVRLSRPAIGTVTVDYATSNGTAGAGEDYTAAAGSVTFSFGETSMTISVPLLGDTEAEEDESFAVTLSNAVNGVISSALATGTIADNDEGNTSG